MLLNKYLTNPYVHCSYSDVKRRTVVREFVRQLYGFDKGKISADTAGIKGIFVTGNRSKVSDNGI